MSDKRVFQIILAVSVLVFGVVTVLYLLPKQDSIPEWAKLLPMFNAIINGTCSVLLVTSLIAIKNKKISLHKKLNITTFLLSSVFLVLYIIFHAFGVETKFPDDNPLRPFYLVILITHIILAATVLPLVLVSLFLGLTGKIERHKKVSRFTFPIWLYVTVTGVVVYLMISPYYQF
ncbi:MAG: putative membrane protein [Bacteroidia bacterium]|jgi:putative membrane protein